jgi:tRNA-specific 2-thiouridylase
VQVQVRHRAYASPAEIVRLTDDEVELALDEPVSAITPGQSLVLYDGERVLGGGFIERGGAGARSALPVLAA